MEINLKKLNEVITQHAIELQQHQHEKDNCSFCLIYYGIAQNQDIINYCCNSYAESLLKVDPTFMLAAYVFGFLAAKKYFETIELEKLSEKCSPSESK